MDSGSTFPPFRSEKSQPPLARGQVIIRLSIDNLSIVYRPQSTGASDRTDKYTDRPVPVLGRSSRRWTNSNRNTRTHSRESSRLKHRPSSIHGTSTLSFLTGQLNLFVCLAGPSKSSDSIERQIISPYMYLVVYDPPMTRR